MASAGRGRRFRWPWRSEEQLRRELDDEIAFHLDMRAEELVGRGVPQKEARRRAEREFGDLGRARASLLASDLRIERRARLGDRLREIASDVRLALRGLRASPGFTLAVTLSLALGIGANTAVFSLLDALLVRSLPVAEPERLVALGDTARTGSLSEGSVRADLFSVPMYRELSDRNRVFSGLYGSGSAGRLVLGSDPGAGEERVRGRLVTGNFFSVLGVSAYRGRTFTAADDLVPGAAPYAVVSYDFWRRRLGGDPAAVGSTLTLDGLPVTVVGVTPPGFFGDVVGSATDLWLPVSMAGRIDPGRDRLVRWDENWLLLMGRLAPGVSLAQARASIQALFAEIVSGGAVPADLLPEDPRELEVEVSPGAAGFSYWRSRFSRPLATLMTIVALVLLIACVNAASLLLERATGRRGELSVRLALGAGRGRLVRRLLTESLILAGLAGALGVLLAYWGDAALVRLVGVVRPTDLGHGPDLRVLGFTAAVSLVTGLVFGLLPALQASRVELASALRESGRGAGASGPGRRWPLRKLLVVSQVAVALLLLVGAGLFVRTLVNLRRLDLGYPRDGLLVVAVDPAAAGYRGARLDAYVSELLERLGAVPDADGATLSENGLFSGTESSTPIAIAGRPAAESGEEVRYDRVGPRYFEVVGIPLVLGRGIGAGDRAGPQTVAVVNEAMARRYFPGESPLGRRFTEPGAPAGASYEIVGVSRDVHDHDLRGPVQPRFYAPALPAAAELSALHFEVRGADAENLLGAVRAAVHAIDPRVPVVDIAPLAANVGRFVGDERLVAGLSAVFGLLALGLAAVGIYGVIAYAVSRRTSEIGVRMALGASRRRLLGMVLAETLGLAGAGVVLGLAAVAGSTRLLASRLFGLSAHDPATVVGAVAVLAVVATVAGLVPGARATHVDPTSALRSE